MITKVNLNKVTYWIKAGNGRESRTHHIQLTKFHDPHKQYFDSYSTLYELNEDELDLESNGSTSSSLAPVGNGIVSGFLLVN